MLCGRPHWGAFWGKMKLLIESLKSKHEIIQILKENTHEDIPILKAVFSENVFNKFFRGTISYNSFKIQRCVIGQMGFVPLAYGTITENEKGTKISINIKRMKGINIFLSFWFGGLILLMISIFIVNTKYFFIPLGMLIYGFLLNYIPYKTESKKAIIKLQEIIK